MGSGTFVEDPIPKLHYSQECSLHRDQSCDGASCSQREFLLDDHAPVRADDSSLSVADEVQTVLAVADAPVAGVTTIQGPEGAQDSGPSIDELLEKVLDDLDVLEDRYNCR